MATSLVLLPSPLVGPSAWRAVADQLRAAGWAVLVPSCGSPRTPAEVLGRFLAEIPEDRELVLIPHSNAGLFVPAIAQERPVVAQIFVDASLPPPSGPAPMAPLDMRESLAQLSDPAGLLPPWTQWWEPADLARLFPSEEARVQVEAGQPRLPLSYFDGAVPIAEGWDAMPSGYVAFGDTYAKAAERAARLGWPVRTLNGAHLHMLVDPESVAGTITELVAALGVASPA